MWQRAEIHSSIAPVSPAPLNPIINLWTWGRTFLGIRITPYKEYSDSKNDEYIVAVLSIIEPLSQENARAPSVNLMLGGFREVSQFVKKHLFI